MPGLRQNSSVLHLVTLSSWNKFVETLYKLFSLWRDHKETCICWHAVTILQTVLLPVLSFVMQKGTNSFRNFLKWSWTWQVIDYMLGSKEHRFLEIATTMMGVWNSWVAFVIFQLDWDGDFSFKAASCAWLPTYDYLTKSYRVLRNTNLQLIKAKITFEMFFTKSVLLIARLNDSIPLWIIQGTQSFAYQCYSYAKRQYRNSYRIFFPFPVSKWKLAPPSTEPVLLIKTITNMVHE